METITNEQLKKDIVDFLENNTTLSLATVDADSPWIATVFYVQDESMNLYFLSSKDALHSAHIAKCNSVAVAIYDPKSIFGKVYGVQAKGKVTSCNLVEIVKMGFSYVKKFPQAKEEFLHPNELFDAAVSGRFYKFTPEFFVLRTPEVKQKTGKSTVKLVL